MPGMRIRETDSKHNVTQSVENSPYGCARKPAVPRLTARKPTAAQQVATVYARLKHLMLTEWPSIRSLNLGNTRLFYI